jgi:N-acetylmuramoyl-L-alanine amidase
MKTINLPSPNFDSRDGQAVDMLVLHYTGMPTAKDALDRLQDPNAKVSAHYVVDEDGTVYKMVDEENRAWHAGVSSWRGADNINHRSIGIEVVNPGDRPFPKVQMDAVATLSKDIIMRHNIPSWNVVGHSDVAPGRKNDPGEFFDWKILAERGVGLLPNTDKSLLASLIETPMKWVSRLFCVTPDLASSSSISTLQKKLGQYGYPIDINGIYDEKSRTAVIAFQQHFRPSRVDGIWDNQCNAALDDLLRRAPAVRIPAPDSRMIASA